jgi:hypothetical protein
LMTGRRSLTPLVRLARWEQQERKAPQGHLERMARMEMRACLVPQGLWVRRVGWGRKGFKASLAGRALKVKPGKMVLWGLRGR